MYVYQKTDFICSVEEELIRLCMTVTINQTLPETGS